MSKKSIWITIVLGFCVIGFLYFHYGIYKYDKLNQKTPIRINRFTGETWLLNDDGVWMNKDDIAKQHQEEALAEKDAKEEELKKKDVPTVTLRPILPDSAVPDNGSKFAKLRAELDGEISVIQGKSATIDYLDQTVDIWWENYDIDTLAISINGHKLDDFNDDIKGNYYSDITFNQGENEIELQTSRGTYKYYVNYQ